MQLHVGILSIGGNFGSFSCYDNVKFPPMERFFTCQDLAKWLKYLPIPVRDKRRRGHGHKSLKIFLEYYNLRITKEEMIENIDGRDEQDIQRGFRREVIKLLGLIFMSLIAIFVVVVMLSINQSRLEALEKEILSKL